MDNEREDAIDAEYTLAALVVSAAVTIAIAGLLWLAPAAFNQ